MSFSDYKIIYKGQEYTIDEINQIPNIKPHSNGSYYDKERNCFICEYVDFEDNDYLLIDKEKYEIEINELLLWFKNYDEAQSQFNRKKFLFDNGHLDYLTFNIEKEKIMALSFEAETKSNRIKELRGLINGHSSE